MDKLTAADAIRNLAVQYQAMVYAADALQAIGSLEQAANEAQAATDDANARRDQALQDLDNAQQAVSAAKEQALSILAEARDTADQTVIAAKSKAETIMANANQQGQIAIDAAAAKANGLVSSVSGKVDDLTAKAQQLGSDIAELEAKRDAAVADAQAADDKLAAVQSKIRKLAGV